MNPKYYPRFNDPYDSRQAETEVRKALIDVYNDLNSINGSTTTITGSSLAPKYGLTLSNSGTTSIGISAGGIPDTTSTYMLTVSTAYIKTFSSWTVGSGNGMLDNGTVAVGWYSVWIIKNISSGVTDYIASLSATSPLLPTGFTVSRRIGWVYISAISPTVVKPFTQTGNRFTFNSIVLELNDAIPAATTRQTVTPIVPPSVLGYFTVGVAFAGVSYIKWGAVFEDDTAASATYYSMTTSAGSTRDYLTIEIPTSTTSTIFYRVDTVAALVSLVTIGWYDDLTIQ